uniref:(northern house mosquito) hypothetical protein n=1 Tax=Culex pipiens TaxID=7175 RepID=A0A8D8AZD4_CULPI
MWCWTRWTRCWTWASLSRWRRSCLPPTSKMRRSSRRRCCSPPRVPHGFMTWPRNTCAHSSSTWTSSGRRHRKLQPLSSTWPSHVTGLRGRRSSVMSSRCTAAATAAPSSSVRPRRRRQSCP